MMRLRRIRANRMSVASQVEATNASYYTHNGYYGPFQETASLVLLKGQSVVGRLPQPNEAIRAPERTYSLF